MGVNMKYFAVLSALVGCTMGAPVAEADAEAQALLLAKPYLTSGAASGPLTPLVGDLVATNRGYASLSLEGFSEDVNEDGFVDPIAHAVPVVAVAAPVAYHHAVAAPIAYHHAIAAPVAVAAPAVAAVKAAVVPAATYAYAAPAAYHVAAPPVVQHVGYQVHHQVHHVPQVSVQKHTSTHTTHHVINHAPVIGAFAGLIPVAAAAPAVAAEAVAEAAPVVEEA